MFHSILKGSYKMYSMSDTRHINIARHRKQHCTGEAVFMYSYNTANLLPPR